MSDIHVVTLDLWQTLIIDQREWGRERTRLRIEGAMEALRDVGESVTEEQAREAYRTCYRTCRAVLQQGQDVSFDEQVGIFVSGIANGLLERISCETFSRIRNRYADSFFESPPLMADGVSEMLQTLKDRDYRIGLISNTGMTPGRLFRIYMEQLGIIRYFDSLTFSDEVLLAKPSKAIFRYALENLGCIAEQAVHVGDHRRNDILGAQGAGIRTVWLEGVDDSEVQVTPTITIRHISDLPVALEQLSVT